MKLLLISNSTNSGEEYLDYPKENIKNFLGKKSVKALFIPYAGVTFSYEEYEKKVKSRFNEIGHDIISIHRFENPVKAVEDAEAIVVGGGNTFQLANMIQKNKLIEPIRKKVFSGTKYIGWSAGSNMACPTIKTTNDMPIVQPESFSVFNFLNFQINPHYLDANPEGHAGETREMRLEEFLELNQNIYVFGLREGTMLHLEKGKMKLIGERSLRIFKFGEKPKELSSKDDLTCFL